nr:hypothetical protein [Tanacetum cinerariifolium]
MSHLQLTSQPKPTFDEVKVDVGGDMSGSIAEKFNVGDKVGVVYFMGFKEENDGLHCSVSVGWMEGLFCTSITSPFFCFISVVK